MKCPECGNPRMQRGTWIDKPNTEEGETGTIKQKIRYCSNCMYQVVDEVIKKKSIILAECRNFDFKVFRLDFDLSCETVY